MSDIDTTEDDQSPETPEDPAAKFYVVDPNFKPLSTSQTGSQRTDIQGGHDVRGISGAFTKAYNRSVLTAKKALDPNDATPATHVTFPTTEAPDHETVAKRLLGLYEKVKDEVGFSLDDAVAASGDRGPGTIDKARAEIEGPSDDEAPADDPEGSPEALGAAPADPEAPESDSALDGPRDGNLDTNAEEDRTLDPAVTTSSAEGAPDGTPASPIV